MARFPTYDEYQDKPEKGIKKCDELLKRQPKDINLLTTKLSLLSLLNDRSKTSNVVSQLVATQTRDLNEVALIEEAIYDQLHIDAFPHPLTAGPEVRKLWEDASKAASNLNAKLDIQSLRFTRAIYDNRLQDAQQALIQLKVIKPKTRSFFMAHAAVTQMLSSSKDDLQSRLALSLARKAVSEKFDEQDELDCRVPGQIFALQGSRADLKGIAGKKFAESKQVNDTLKWNEVVQSDGELVKLPSEEVTIRSGTPQWLDCQIRGYKSRLLSQISYEDSCINLHALAAESIQTYRTSVGSLDRFRYRHVCDLIFIAISALVRAWEQKKGEDSLLQAAFLAEALLHDNPNIHEAKVILIHLYMRLELGALAMKHWNSLSVKEMQYDTVGHSFLTRISITHPHAIASAKAKHNEPYAITSHALSVYHRCEEKLAQAEASTLSNGQTGMLFDLHELRQNFRLSLTRRIISLEQRRLSRLFKYPLDIKAVQIVPRLSAQWLDIKDNRDFDAAFNYGYDVERVLHGHNDPRLWILYNLTADTVWCIVNNLVGPVKDHDALLQRLDEESAKVGASYANLTIEERRFGELARRMLKILVAQHIDGAVSSKDLTDISGQLTEVSDSYSFLDEGASTLRFHLQTHYLYLDVIRSVVGFCDFTFPGSNAALRKDLEQLRKAAEQLFGRLQEHAIAQATRVQMSNVRSSLEDNETLWPELKALNESGIREFCAGVVEAAKSGWRGVELLRIGN